MTDSLKRHGGARVGAGRPKNEPLQLPDLPVTNDPKAFLQALMGNPAADNRTRLNAAATLMPYCHAKISEGAKDQAQTAAQRSEPENG